METLVVILTHIPKVLYCHVPGGKDAHIMKIVRKLGVQLGVGEVKLGLDVLLLQ